MTVVRILDPQRYQGVSSDSKPHAAAGSTFVELDTGNRSVSDGSAWHSLPAGMRGSP